MVFPDLLYSPQSYKLKLTLISLSKWPNLSSSLFPSVPLPKAYTLPLISLLLPTSYIYICICVQGMDLHVLIPIDEPYMAIGKLPLWIGWFSWNCFIWCVTLVASQSFFPPYSLFWNMCKIEYYNELSTQLQQWSVPVESCFIYTFTLRYSEANSTHYILKLLSVNISTCIHKIKGLFLT